MLSRPESLGAWYAARFQDQSDTMTSEQAAQFDREMRELLLPFAQDDCVTMQITGRVVWGKPLAPPKGE